MSRSKKWTDEELIALAVEPVPLGSGMEELGEGDHIYCKTNRRDGSTRVFHFRTEAALSTAMAASMAADEPLTPDALPPGWRPAQSVSQARRELKRLMLEPPPAWDLPEPGPAWHAAYTRHICRYLLGSLTNHELLAWKLAFTACHELVSHAWAARPADPVHWREREAWEAVDAETHLAFADMYSLNPPDIDVLAFVPLLRGFITHLRDEGAMTEDTWTRLDLEYRRFDFTAGPMAAA